MSEYTFSAQLEQVIKATLTDGFISEKERTVLYRLAEGEGISREAVDQMLNERLQQWRVEKKARLHKCPQCGTVLEAFVTKCPNCGAEIAVGRASSVKAIEEKLASLPTTGNNKVDMAQRRDVISTFPVPNTREDLLEFLQLAAERSQLKGGVTANPVRRFLLVVGIFIGLFFLLFLVIYLMAEETKRGERLLQRGLAVIIGSGAFGLILGAPFAFLYAVKGGSKKNNRHNELTKVWKDKFRQCMTKARLTLHATVDLTRLDQLEKEVNKHII